MNRIMLKLVGTVLASLLLFSPLACSAKKKSVDVETLSEEQKVFYFLGTVLNQNLTVLDLSEEEFDLMLAGLQAAHKDEAPELEEATYGVKLRDLTGERVRRSQLAEAEEGKAFAADMAKTAGAVVTDSGLIYIESTAGTGVQPTGSSRVKAHYTGTLRDGTVFDSSVQRGQPLEIGLNQVIPCWTQGIAMMKEGGKATLVCPPDIAYGEAAQGAIPPNSTLIFEVELLEVL